MDTFKVIFSEEKEGVFAISLVENPAIEIDFIALSKENVIKLAEVSEEKRLLISPVLIPNQPIYRKDENGNEFNIVFPEETILKAQQNFYKQGYQRNSNIEHDNKLTLNDVTFVESWIKEDDTHDKSLKYGFDLPNGTWFAVMKVENDETWKKVKNGEVKGFSIEGNFDLEKINLAKNMSFKEQIRNALAEILGEKVKKEETPTIELGAIATTDGSFKIEFEGEALAQDSDVWITDENGEKQPVPDGEYNLENDMIVVIADSKCVEIKEQEAPEQPAEDVEMADEKYTALETKVNELASAFENFKVSMAKQISEGFTKLSEAVKEEKQVEEIKLTKKQDAENERKSILDLIKEK